MDQGVPQIFPETSWGSPVTYGESCPRNDLQGLVDSRRDVAEEWTQAPLENLAVGPTERNTKKPGARASPNKIHYR